MKRTLPREMRDQLHTLRRAGKKLAQRQGGLLARLVSVPSLDTIRHEDKTALLAEAKGSGFRCVEAVDTVLWPILLHTHAVAWPLIQDLLTGEQVSLQPL